MPSRASWNKGFIRKIHKPQPLEGVPNQAEVIRSVVGLIESIQCGIIFLGGLTQDSPNRQIPATLTHDDLFNGGGGWNHPQLAFLKDLLCRFKRFRGLVGPFRTNSFWAGWWEFFWIGESGAYYGQWRHLISHFIALCWVGWVLAAG